MVIVTAWRGRTAAALRLSLRMTCDDFAAHLGVSARGVAKWEALPDGELALRTQQVLDVALKRADDDVQARFGQLLVEAAPQPDHAPENTPTLLVPPRLVLGVPHRVTPELLTSLRQGLRHQYTAEPSWPAGSAPRNHCTCPNHRAPHAGCQR
jgi:hypothetical protein